MDEYETHFTVTEAKHRAWRRQSSVPSTAATSTEGHRRWRPVPQQQVFQSWVGGPGAFLFSDGGQPRDDAKINGAEGKPAISREWRQFRVGSGEASGGLPVCASLDFGTAACGLLEEEDR
ncbi:unnamed protein product [Cuscuta epithymum]|uniref:Uncharacterized protein n=1 Tax=Cuscuta epithymum TaxID=186058 RepID=A0AAV0CHH2_9ASTE|nr:unnamed protein product [Cuscuta epithymum]